MFLRICSFYNPNDVTWRRESGVVRLFSPSNNSFLVQISTTLVYQREIYIDSQEYYSSVCTNYNEPITRLFQFNHASKREGLLRLSCEMHKDVFDSHIN
jgi:hypothetical protein